MDTITKEPEPIETDDNETETVKTDNSFAEYLEVVSLV